MIWRDRDLCRREPTENRNILIDEFGNCDFGGVAMRLVADKTHGKDVAQRGRD